MRDFSALVAGTRDWFRVGGQVGGKYVTFFDL